MRSNGAVHIGNDTFVIATQDDDEHLFLFTSAFPADEQREAITLERRVRLTPKSSLLSDADVLTRYLNELSARAAQTDSVARITAGDQLGVGFSVKRSEAAEDADLVVSSASSSSGRSDDEGEADADDLGHHGVAREARQPHSAVRRHALFAAPDGQQIIAISNQLRHHYIFDIGRNGFDMVCEFETDTLVRSLCWYPDRPNVLLLLLASGELVSYDTAYARFGVVYPHAVRLDLVPLLRRYARAEDDDDAAHGTGSRRDSAGTHTDARTETTTTTRRGTTTEDAEKEASRSTVSRRGPLPLNAYGQPDHTYAWHDGRAAGERGRASMSTSVVGETTTNPAGTRLALTERPRTAHRGEKGGGHGGTDEDATSSSHQLHVDVRTTMSQHLSSLLRPPPPQPPSRSAPHTAVAASSSALTLAQASPCAVAAAGATAEGDGTRGVDALASTTLFHPAPPFGRDIVAVTSPVSALALVHQEGRDGGGRALPVALRRERDCPTCPFDVVDMCIVPASRSRAPVVLLLSSSGDIFSLRLDDNCLPRRTEVPYPDGRLHLEAEAKAPRRAGVPILHHLVASPSRAIDEQALRLSAAVLDDDTGLCVATVCWSSGALKGVYLDEPDLVARNVHATRGGGPSARGFTVQLGPALPVASLLSPAVPSTSHMVHMETQGNLLLIRYGQDDAAAYVVALPIWDVARQGWTYWRPPCCEPSCRRTEALRLPVQRTADGRVPAPLALRLPYDVTGASLALGVREIVVAPELARLSAPAASHRRRHTTPSASSSSSSSLCPRQFTVVASVASLLQSALLAGGQGWSLGTNGGGGDGGADDKATTFARLPDAVADCHRGHLCAQPRSVVLAQMNLVGDLLERALDDVKAEEQMVHHREVQLRARVAELSQQIHEDVATVRAWQKTLLDALVHRRGVEALVTGNDRLGDIHRMLNEYDVILDAHRQKMAGCQEKDARGA